MKRTPPPPPPARKPADVHEEETRSRPGKATISPTNHGNTGEREEASTPEINPDDRDQEAD